MKEFLDQLTAKYGLEARANASDVALAELIESTLFPQQQALIQDAYRRKAALCPRRAGKSWCALSYAYITCLRKPYSAVAIVGLTLKSLRSIYFQTLVPTFNRKFGIDAKIHHTELRIRFGNGSVITFSGAETKAEIEKLRGLSLDLVVLDECKSFPAGTFYELLTDVLEPACMDRGGTILMIGTPGNVLAGLFYEATYPGFRRDGAPSPVSRTYEAPEKFWRLHEDLEPEWSRHTWTVGDNVMVPTLLTDAKRIKKRSGWDDDHPTWLREYCGQWVPSESAFVYAFATLANEKPEKVYWAPDFKNGDKFGLPQDGDWRFILGVDLGFEDDFAAVVGAYSLTTGELRQVWEYKAVHQTVDQIAERISEAVALFGKIDAMVADSVGLGKLVVETINKRHGLFIQAAEKREKNDHIELLNADFHAGKCKLLRGSELSIELLHLQWDLSKGSKEEMVRGGRLKELHSCPNHAADAWLYLWRYSYHHFGTHALKTPGHGTEAWWNDWEARSIEKLNQPKASYWESLRDSGQDPLGKYYRRYGN